MFRSGCVEINESIKSYKITKDELPTVQGKMHSMDLSIDHIENVIFCDDTYKIPIIKDMGILMIGNSKYNHSYEVLHHTFTKINKKIFKSYDDINHMKMFSILDLQLYYRLKKTIIYCDEITFKQVMLFLQKKNISKTLYIVCINFSEIESDYDIIQNIQPVLKKIKLYKKIYMSPIHTPAVMRTAAAPKPKSFDRSSRSGPSSLFDKFDRFESTGPFDQFDQFESAGTFDQFDRFESAGPFDQSGPSRTSDRFGSFGPSRPSRSFGPPDRFGPFDPSDPSSSFDPVRSYGFLHRK